MDKFTVAFDVLIFLSFFFTSGKWQEFSRRTLPSAMHSEHGHFSNQLNEA